MSRQPEAFRSPGAVAQLLGVRAREAGRRLRGESRPQGFRNRDLRRLLEPGAPTDPLRGRQASGRMTRWLRLLRAQGLIRKVPHTRYYRLTQRGEEVLTTAQRLRTLHLNALAA